MGVICSVLIGDSPMSRIIRVCPRLRWAMRYSFPVSPKVIKVEKVSMLQRTRAKRSAEIILSVKVV